MEARNYAESVLNSSIADEGSKRIAELTIHAIDDDINNYNQTKTPLSDGVTFENEKAQTLGTFDEALENLVQATRLDIKDNLAQTVGLMENLQKTSGLIQKGLYERGININAFDYMNLPSETKQNVKSLMKTINNMDGGFPYKVAFDGSLDSSINGYIKDGKIVLKPNIDNNYQSVLSHEITHTLENSKNYQTIKNLIKESSDYQEYYDKYSKLYKGVADNIESEVLAKYIENHLADRNLIDKLVKYDESLGYRIFENLKSNLSSDLDTKVENSWLKAFQETKKQRLTLEGIKQSINDNLIEELEDVKNGKYNTNEITVGKTSENLANILNIPEEYANLDVVLDTKKAKMIMGTKENNDHYHGLIPSKLYEALIHSEDPVMAFVYKNKNGDISRNRINLVTDVFDERGGDNNPIIVSFEFSAGKDGGLDINKDITVFGKKNLDYQIDNALKENRMLYVNEEKANRNLQGVRQVHMPEVPTSFIDNITSFWNNFKPQRDIETAKEKEPKEKEGAGRTVSDIGPRDNPKAPSYLNDTNFSEKINDLKNNSLNNEKSVNTFDRAYQSRLGQISTDFNNNVTNFWNNFKPQRDIVSRLIDFVTS